VLRPEAYDGRGDAEFTFDAAEALRFATFGEAIEFWRQPSKRRPLRGDGLPNRPLCAFSVEVRTLPEVAAVAEKA
jgi:hypothetical protein